MLEILITAPWSGQILCHLSLVDRSASVGLPGEEGVDGLPAGVKRRVPGAAGQMQ